jgi:hypothetical protein
VPRFIGCNVQWVRERIAICKSPGIVADNVKTRVSREVHVSKTLQFARLREGIVDGSASKRAFFPQEALSEVLAPRLEKAGPDA